MMDPSSRKAKIRASGPLASLAGVVAAGLYYGFLLILKHTIDLSEDTFYIASYLVVPIYLCISLGLLWRLHGRK